MVYGKCLYTYYLYTYICISSLYPEFTGTLTDFFKINYKIDLNSNGMTLSQTAFNLLVTSFHSYINGCMFQLNVAIHASNLSTYKAEAEGL